MAETPIPADVLRTMNQGVRQRYAIGTTQKPPASNRNNK